jgi:hypothetical protein
MRIALLLVAMLIQVAWSDLLRIGDSAPNVFFLGLIWCTAVMSGPAAALTGFLAGLGLDLLGGLDPLGASALAGTTVAFFASRSLDPERKLNVPHLLGRSFLILAPVMLFLGNLRYQGMDYDAFKIAVFTVLPSLLVTLGLLALLFLLPAWRSGRSG